MIKIKKLASRSILTDIFKKEKAGRLTIKDKFLLKTTIETEKIKPHTEPIIENNELKKFAVLSFFWQINELIAPIKKIDSKTKKLTCEAIISDILY